MIICLCIEWFENAERLYIFIISMGYSVFDYITKCNEVIKKLLKSYKIPLDMDILYGVYSQK